MSLTQPDFEAQADKKWVVKGYTYEGYGTEATAFRKHSFAKSMSSGPTRKTPTRELTPAEKKWRREQNRERAIRRAKSRVRRKVLAACLTILLTLTYGENMQDRKKALKHFRRFQRLMSERFGEFDFVGCMERQKRGALHFHLAIGSWLPHREVWRLWCKASGQVFAPDTDRAEGFVSLNQVNQQKAVSYLSKYLSKAFDDPDRPAGAQMYYCSDGLLLSVTQWHVEYDNRADAISMLFAIAGKTGYYWLEQLQEKGIGYANDF